MDNVLEQVQSNARRALSAMNLEAIILAHVESGQTEPLKALFCLEFDPIEAGYAS